jgi:glycosyltransferase involved in cell wall biosynthesis
MSLVILIKVYLTDKLNIPTISVVIPTHNRPDGLQDAVKSIFVQTMLPKELIVVDDGSTPELTERVFKGAPADFITRLLRNDEPRGAPQARNRGILEASGEWIAFLDDDDAFFPEKIETITRVVQDNPDADLIYHPAEIHMVQQNIKYISRPQKLDSPGETFETLLVNNVVGGTSMVVVKKKTLLSAGMFSEQMPALQDYDLWLRLARNRSLFYLLNKPLTYYRYNTSKKSITKSTEARDVALAIIEETYQEAYGWLDPSKKRKYRERNLRSKVFKALINLQKRTAFKNQLQVLFFTRRFKDLLLLCVIPFGSGTVFKLRSFSY